MTKEDLEALAVQYREKADRNYWSYQETGNRRYYREQSKNSGLADALSAAADAWDEHNELGNLKAKIHYYAQMADRAVLHDAPHDELVKLLNDFIWFAVVSCRYKRDETVKK